MSGQRPLEPLQGPHRRRPLAAEEQVQQRHEEPDAEPLEEHDEEGAHQHGREQERLPDEIRAEEREDFPEFGELLEPGLHRWPVVYGSITSRDEPRDSGELRSRTAMLASSEPARSRAPGTHANSTGPGAGLPDRLV